MNELTVKERRRDAYNTRSGAVCSGWGAEVSVLLLHRLWRGLNNSLSTFTS